MTSPIRGQATIRVRRARPGRARLRQSIAGVLLGVLALSSCGNDAQSSPEVVPTGASTSTAAPSTAAPTTGASTNALETTPQATATASDPTSARPTTSAPTTDAPTTTGGNEGKPPTSETAPSSAEGFKLPDSLLAVKGPVLPKSDPVSLTIPAINVQSSLMDLGLNPDGTVQVPSLDDPDAEAGWYTGSPTPGQQGPSILLGHIDSRRYGPGVFYDLDKLVPGDTVEVTRADGSVATFTIDKVQSYLKSEFPTEEVYGNIDHAGIRLITCGGAFNSDEGSYESNIIAFGSLVS